MRPTYFPAFSNIGAALGLSTGLFWVLLAVLVLWTIVLKGFSLWHAARNYQRYWFVVLLVVNTFGILELIYLTWFRTNKDASHTPSLFATPEGPESSPSV